MGCLRGRHCLPYVNLNLCSVNCLLPLKMTELTAGSDGKEDRSDGVVSKPVLGPVKAQGRRSGYSQVQDRGPACARRARPACDEPPEGEMGSPRAGPRVLRLPFASGQVLESSSSGSAQAAICSRLNTRRCSYTGQHHSRAGASSPASAASRRTASAGGQSWGESVRPGATVTRSPFR